MRKHFLGPMFVGCLFVIALIAGGAQTSALKPLPPGGVVGHGSGAAPAVPQVSNGTVFFSNLGPGGAFSSTGWCVAGASSSCGSRYDDAMPFIASSSGRVTQIDVGLTHFDGTNAALVKLAADSNGVPGQILASWPAANQGAYGSTCCPTTFTAYPPVSVVAGRRYWVIAVAGAPDTNDAFMWNYWGTNGAYAFSTDGTTWSLTFGAIGAFDVLGCPKLCKVYP